MAAYLYCSSPSTFHPVIQLQITGYAIAADAIGMIIRANTFTVLIRLVSSAQVRTMIEMRLKSAKKKT